MWTKVCEDDILQTAREQWNFIRFLIYAHAETKDELLIRF